MAVRFQTISPSERRHTKMLFVVTPAPSCTCPVPATYIVRGCVPVGFGLAVTHGSPEVV